MDDGTVIGHSRVIKWQRSVHESYESYRDDISAISSRASGTRPAPTEVAKAASVVSKAPTTASIARSMSEPVAVPQVATASETGDGAAKKIIGTLLGAAAGAAVAYALARSEHDSAKKESDFSAFMEAKNIVRGAAGYLAQASSQPKPPMQDPLPAIEAAPPAPQSVHRNTDAQSHHSSTPPQARSVYTAPRQIEAPPTYYSASLVSRNQGPAPLALEYVPAHSVAPSQARSRYTAARSVTSPELLTIEKARSTASTARPRDVASIAKAHSIAPSAAPSSLISSFVPDHVPRRVSEGSVHSHHSSRSKAKSSHTDASKHTSKSKHSSRHRSEAVESSPSPPPAYKAPSKAASIVSSILGRDNKSSASKHDDFIDDLEIEEVTEDDMDTVVPSDSISQIGSTHSRRTHRSHKSKKHSDGSEVSKHSSTSKHSHRSHRSHKTRSHHDSDNDDDASQHSAESKSRRRHRPSVVSEPSDASTVRPIKSSSRKDSVTQGQYDGLFDEVKYGAGSVAVRGITPSMLSAAGKNRTRTVVRHDMAQKARLFDAPA